KRRICALGAQTNAPPCEPHASRGRGRSAEQQEPDNQIPEWTPPVDSREIDAVQPVAHPAPAPKLVVDEAGWFAAHGVEVEHRVGCVVEGDTQDREMHLAMWTRVIVRVIRREQREPRNARTR